MFLRRIVIILVFAASGCVTPPSFEGAWYYYDSPPRVSPADNGGLKLDEMHRSGLYLALVNRTAKQIILTGLRINSPKADDLMSTRAGSSMTLAPGQAVLFPIISSKPYCEIPMMLYLSTQSEGHRRLSLTRLRVQGALPGALPDEWIERCAVGA